MRITILSDHLAAYFLALVPSHKCSALIARLLEQALQEQALAEACIAANADEALKTAINVRRKFVDIL
jgi:hypothetical protein